MAAPVGVCVVGIVADVVDRGVEIARFVCSAGANSQPAVGVETDRLVVVDETPRSRSAVRERGSRASE